MSARLTVRLLPDNDDDEPAAFTLHWLLDKVPADPSAIGPEYVVPESLNREISFLLRENKRAHPFGQLVLLLIRKLAETMSVAPSPSEMTYANVWLCPEPDDGVTETGKGVLFGA